jgi:hypothetical protein
MALGPSYDRPMSTTVIASRHGFTLQLLPAAGPALDLEGLRRVLARHGLGLIEGSDLARANEFIAAQDLEPAHASRLAEDLRELGLTVRVVNRTGLTGSNRVGIAAAGQFVLGMGALLVGLAGWTGLVEGNPWLGGALLGAGVVAAFNALTLQLAGGSALRVAGAPGETVPLLTDQLSDLSEHLPSHLVAPLLERARRLEEHARRDPEGQAALELQGLVEELQGLQDEEAAAEARELRQELARAKRAMRETQGR